MLNAINGKILMYSKNKFNSLLFEKSHGPVINNIKIKILSICYYYLLFFTEILYNAIHFYLLIKLNWWLVYKHLHWVVQKLFINFIKINKDEKLHCYHMIKFTIIYFWVHVNEIGTIFEFDPTKTLMQNTFFKFYEKPEFF